MISAITAAGWSVWAVIGPWIVKRGAIIGVIAAGLVAWQVNNAIERSKGRSQVVQASQQEGKKRNADAAKRRRAAEAPGSTDRLRDRWCRDC